MAKGYSTTNLINQRVSGKAAAYLLDELQHHSGPLISEVARDLSRDLAANGVEKFSVKTVREAVLCTAPKGVSSEVFEILDQYQDIYPEYDFAAS